MKSFKIIVEKHDEEKGIPTNALRDVKSAIQFHIETFGAASLEG